MINSRYEKTLLGDLVSTMHQGINTAADKIEYSSSGMPIIQSRNFTSGKLDVQKAKFLGTTDVKKYGKKYIAKKGDVLFSNIGTVGKSVVVNDCPDFMFAWNVFLIRPKHDLISNIYLQYYLSYLLKLGAYEPYFTGGTVKFLNKKTISSFNIPLPPLSEQQKISEILDAADELIQKDQLLIDHYTTLSESLFLDMFGDPIANPMKWEKIKLEKLGKITSGSTPSRGVEEYYQGDIPWVKTTEVKGKTITKTLESISELALRNSSCKLNPSGSLIVAMYGQGKTRGQIGRLGIDAATNQACAVIPPSNLMNFEYLFSLLKLSYVDLRSLGRGGNQPNLNCGLIKSYSISNPPINLQRQFAERIVIIEKQKQQAEVSLEQSNNLFNSLLQKAFTGELTKKDQSS